MFKGIISVVLFAASALGAIQFTSAPTTVEAGKSYVFAWTSDGSGPVTILLKNGPTNNLQTVGTITTSGSGGSYTWTAPSSYAPGSYAFEIDQQGSAPNYWGGVTYTGGSAASSAASSAAVSSAASVSSAPASVTSKPASASSMSSGYSNKTTTSTTLSTSGTSSSTSKAASASATVTSSNSATALGSPVALVLGALAAMLYLQ